MLSTAGDERLGGEDFDELLLRHAAAAAGVGADALAADRGAADRLRAACRRAKEELTDAEVATVTCDAFAPRAVELRVTRAELAALGAPLLARARAVAERAVADARLSAADIDEVVVVGGGARMPAVRALLSELFCAPRADDRARAPRELCTSVSAETAVAEGCAIRAAILAGVEHRVLRDVLMMDALPLSLGVETADGAMEVRARARAARRRRGASRLARASLPRALPEAPTRATRSSFSPRALSR